MSARLRQAFLIEAGLVAALFLASAWWATSYWNASIAGGREPLFYQEYFEPAVMMACGKGFVVSATQPKPLEDFLWRRKPGFSCADLPSDLRLGVAGNHQWGMAYLMMLVSAAWRVLGISWTGLGPLCGALFGTMVAAAYGIFRLGMGRVISVAGSVALAVSTIQLQNAPQLRDSAKAPFALALVLLLGWLIKARPAPRIVIPLAVAYGAVLGIGYGFRTDFLVFVPLLILALFAFIEGGLLRHLKLKAVAAVLGLASVVVCAWPVLSAITTKGGCEWHVALLGFSSPFDGDLGVAPAPYSVSYAYLDAFMYREVSSYAARRQPSAGVMRYCSREYDVAGQHFFFDIARAVPADLLTRAYASVRGMWELPFRWTGSPLPGWHPRLYYARERVSGWLTGTGFIAVLLAVLAVASRNPRWAGCLCVLLLYLGGYPALQSDPRHYFHLEFIGWWAMGLVAHVVIQFARAAYRRGAPAALAAFVPDAPAAILRVVAFASVVIAMLAIPLVSLRWYQQREMRAYLDRYIGAPKWPVALNAAAPPVIQDIALRTTPGQPSSSLAQSALLEVDVDATACGGPVAVSFVYPKGPAEGFSQTLTADFAAGGGLTRVFFPAYEYFRGVTVDKPACFRGAFQVADVRPFPLLMAAVLAPGWEGRPLYQRLK